MCALIVVAALLLILSPDSESVGRAGSFGGFTYSFSKVGNRYIALFNPPLESALQLMGAMARLVNEAYGPGLIEDMTVRPVRVGEARAATWKGRNGYTYFFVPTLGSRGEIVRMVFWRSLAGNGQIDRIRTTKSTGAGP